MAAAATISARVRIHGRVQGVWFRAWTAEQARSLGLDGWVRNRADGSVEAVFRGGEASVREMVARCHRGPPAARVERVEETPATEPVPDGFAQLPTG
ncbi:MAG TPA: acylphosphatase [Geminicoccaceae bacterium]|nr:acylphosphatase [Geminicoccaceae bacterium]